MEIIARFFGRKIPRLKVLLATGFVAIPILLFFCFSFCQVAFFFFLSFFFIFILPSFFGFFSSPLFFLSFRAALFRSFRYASNACNHSKGREKRGRGRGRKRGLSGTAFCQEASAFAVLACYVRTDAGNISLFSGSIEWLFFSFCFSFLFFVLFFFLFGLAEIRVRRLRLILMFVFLFF